MGFKPGQSGNPGGRPKLPEDIRQARALNQVELERLLNKFLTYSKQQLRDHIETPGTPATELIICTIIAKAIQGGDPGRFDFLLNRIIGKVKERHELTGENGGPIRITDAIESMSDQELDARLNELLTKAKDATPTERNKRSHSSRTRKKKTPVPAPAS